MYDDRRNMFRMPELSPLHEFRFTLLSIVDDSIHRAQLLYSRDAKPKLVVQDIRLALRRLRSLCGQYGEPNEDRKAAIACATRLEQLAAKLRELDPIMGGPYYIGAIVKGVSSALAMLNAPTPASRVAK